jgi:hypothetical protein
MDNLSGKYDYSTWTKTTLLMALKLRDQTIDKKNAIIADTALKANEAEERAMNFEEMVADAIKFNKFMTSYAEEERWRFVYNMVKDEL